MSTVLVGISGGIDSSVAAWQLQRDGHELVAVTLRLLDSPRSVEAYDTAVHTCDVLGIEHHIIDMRDRFEAEVLAPLVDAFARGYTPEPQLLLSRAVIPALEELADKHGCEKIATGHWAHVTSDASGVNLRKFQLRRPHDLSCDESYLLYQMSQGQLSRWMFPLAHLARPIVRRMSMRAGLVRVAPIASQGHVQFPEGEELITWLASRGLTDTPGDIVDISTQRVLGTHRGLHRYAIGETVTEGSDDDGLERVVIVKDVSSNRLLVGPSLFGEIENMDLRDMVWTSIDVPTEPRSCRAMTKLHGKPLPIHLAILKDGGVQVAFSEPQRGLGPGSEIVLYSDDLVLGGGVVAG